MLADIRIIRETPGVKVHTCALFLTCMASGRLRAFRMDLCHFLRQKLSTACVKCVAPYAQRPGSWIAGMCLLLVLDSEGVYHYQGPCRYSCRGQPSLDTSVPRMSISEEDRLWLVHEKVTNTNGLTDGEDVETFNLTMEVDNILTFACINVHQN